MHNEPAENFLFLPIEPRKKIKTNLNYMISDLIFKKSALWMTGTVAALMLAGGLVSCEKEILTGQPEWLGNSIYERLQEGIEVNGQVKQFNYTLRLIDDLGLKEVLSKTGSKTLFVPDDEAYEAWFKSNSWGVSNFDQLSLAQKKMLLNNSMINNAYLLELMSNVSGNPPQKGLCMRRPTAASIFDSVPDMQVSEMPVNPMLKDRLDAWSSLREAGKPIHILKNAVAAPMIHFLPAFMAKNKITDDDLFVLSNGKSTSISDAWINGVKVISQEQICKNGYVYVVENVIESNRNMATIINDEPEMSGWAALMNRFSAPFVATKSVTADYQRLYNTTDSIYELGYYSDATYGRSAVMNTPQGFKVPARLPFDPANNGYMYANDMGYNAHYDAGAMIVPTNEALDRWWSTAGKGLQDEYGSWDKVPVLTLSKLLRVNMLPSMIESVPSKFGTIVDDAKVELGIKPEDVVKCYMGCNGVVYLVNKVFGPSEYRSVVYPALAHQTIMGVIYYAIDALDFGPFLNSMDSRFSLILPYNVDDSYSEEEKVLHYIDPTTYGQRLMTMFEFYYDEENQGVAAHRYQVQDTLGSLRVQSKMADLPVGNTIVNDRLSDLVDNLIVVGDIEDGKEYYKTKAGSVIRVKGSGQALQIQGGYQMESDRWLPLADKPYDMTENGNGKSYGMSGEMVQTASQSVYQVLKERAAATGQTLFLNLLADDETTSGFLSAKSGSTYCTNMKVNRNVSLFDNYNYTVYVPCDEAIQKLIDDGILPTWDDYAKEALDAEQGKPGASDRAKMIETIIHNFVRYHIQDNAVYIGGVPENGTKYETGKLNPENMRYFSLTVNSNADGLNVTDQLGNVRKAIMTDGNYNRVCREYWIKGDETSTNREIEASSNAVVHFIDGVLLYDQNQLKPWTSLMQ